MNRFDRAARRAQRIMGKFRPRMHRRTIERLEAQLERYQEIADRQFVAVQARIEVARRLMGVQAWPRLAYPAVESETEADGSSASD